MEAKGFILFSKEHKKSEPFSYRKKFGFCCCGAPPGTRTLGPLIKRANRRFVSIYGSFESSLFFNQINVIFSPSNFCALCRIFAAKSTFCTF